MAKKKMEISIFLNVYFQYTHVVFRDKVVTEYYVFYWVGNQWAYWKLQYPTLSVLQWMILHNGRLNSNPNPFNDVKTTVPMFSNPGATTQRVSTLSHCK